MRGTGLQRIVYRIRSSASLGIIRAVGRHAEKEAEHPHGAVGGVFQQHEFIDSPGFRPQHRAQAEGTQSQQRHSEEPKKEKHLHAHQLRKGGTGDYGHAPGEGI